MRGVAPFNCCGVSNLGNSPQASARLMIITSRGLGISPSNRSTRILTLASAPSLNVGDTELYIDGSGESPVSLQQNRLEAQALTDFKPKFALGAISLFIRDAAEMVMHVDREMLARLI